MCCCLHNTACVCSEGGGRKGSGVWESCTTLRGEEEETEASVRLCKARGRSVASGRTRVGEGREGDVWGAEIVIDRQN